MDTFDLSIEYKGRVQDYPCIVQRFSYTYRFTVIIDAVEVIFEPDEEGSIRARTPDGSSSSSSTREQISLIGQELEKLMNER